MTATVPTGTTTDSPAAPSGEGTLRGEAGILLRGIGSIKLPEFIIFALMIADVIPIPHANEMFLALLILLALFRKPLYALGNLQLLVPAFAIALTYIGLVSLMPAEPGAADWRFRLIRIIAVTIMMFVVATGRRCQGVEATWGSPASSRANASVGVR